MTSTEWSAFLLSWQEEVELIVSLIPDDVLGSADKVRMFGEMPMALPANGAAIEATQIALGLSLPDDVANFYLASDGWRQYGFDEHDLTVLPLASLHRLAAAGSDLRESVSGYVGSTPDGGVRNFFRADDLRDAVVLSDHLSGCYLVSLNASSLGECSVVRWHSAPKLFPSFSDLMISERKRCLNGLRSML